MRHNQQWWWNDKKLRHSTTRKWINNWITAVNIIWAQRVPESKQIKKLFRSRPALTTSRLIRIFLNSREVMYILRESCKLIFWGKETLFGIQKIVKWSKFVTYYFNSQTFWFGPSWTCQSFVYSRSKKVWNIVFLLVHFSSEKACSNIRIWSA